MLSVSVLVSIWLPELGWDWYYDSHSFTTLEWGWQFEIHTNKYILSITNNTIEPYQILIMLCFSNHYFLLATLACKHCGKWDGIWHEARRAHYTIRYRAAAANLTCAAWDELAEQRAAARLTPCNLHWRELSTCLPESKEFHLTSGVNGWFFFTQGMSISLHSRLIHPLSGSTTVGL